MPSRRTAPTGTTSRLWTARYRVGNAGWQPVPGTVTTLGPATNLRIAEATPVLTGDR